MTVSSSKDDSKFFKSTRLDCQKDEEQTNIIMSKHHEPRSLAEILSVADWQACELV